MPGVPRELAEHTLNIDPKFKPVRQFLRRFNEERRKAIGEEVARLLAVLPLELVLDFPEEERMMQQSSVSISLSF